MKLREYEIRAFSKPVTALADEPRMAADELKAWFDSNSVHEVKPSVNGIIGVLDSPQGADAIGFSGGWETVGDALRELGGEDGRYGELLEEKSAILRRLRGPVGEKARALWARLDQESARRGRLEELTALGGAAIKSMDRADALLRQGVQYANGQLVCSDVEGAVSEARTLMDAFDRLLVEESLPARPSLNRNFSGIMDVGLLSPMLAEMLLGNSLGNARMSVLDACRQVESVMPDLEKALERSRLLCGRLGDQLAELTMDG